MRQGVHGAAHTPGGGQTADLSFTEFVSVVDPILRAQGCDAEGDCHGGGIRGTFQLSPPGAKDTAFDFQQTAQQVNAADPTASLILTEPLDEAAGGTTHAVQPFATVDDEDYQAILAWIEAGVQ